MEELIRFKHLLEYFVAHLEYVQNETVDFVGYDEYIKPFVETNQFSTSGLGYKNHNIQKQVAKWDTYPNGKMCININPAYGRYDTKNSYINWATTGINIIAKWNKEKVSGLMLVNFDDDDGHSQWSEPGCEFSLNDLELYNGETNINDNLRAMFNEFNRRKEELDMLRKMNVNRQKYAPTINLLQSNYNLILTGAPGTGKTFMSKEIAKAMEAEWEMVQFHPSYDYTDFVEGIRPSKDKNFEYTAGIFKQFCAKALNNLQESQKSKELIAKEKDTNERIFSFLATAKTENKKFEIKNGAEYYIGDYDEHTITFYNENNPISKEVVAYIEEIAKLLNSGQVFRKVKDVAEYLNRNHGYQKDSYIFSLYEELSKWKVEDVTVGEIVEKKDYVFIIDEINRGELSKIFGELFGTIEKGYRGEEGRVHTQYQNMIPQDDPFKDGFFIPKNVYIIGTMNDIDRSVESMDFAMRRRFAWKEVTAEESYNTIIKDNKNFSANQKTEIEQRMSRINAEIENRLGRAYQIGAAYFLNLQDDDFEALWKNHLEGLLYEYFRGERDAQKKIDELHMIYCGE